MKTKFFSGSLETLGDRETVVIASDATLDRAGDVLVPEGALLDEYRANPVCLFAHDPTKIIGTASVVVKNGSLVAKITFAPPGISTIADETCGLAKSGVLKGVSVGFESIASVPIRGGGFRYESWKLLEISLVALPCNQSALVVERSFGKGASPSAVTETESSAAFVQRTRDELQRAALAPYQALDHGPLSHEERRVIAAASNSSH